MCGSLANSLDIYFFYRMEMEPKEKLSAQEGPEGSVHERNENPDMTVDKILFSDTVYVNLPQAMEIYDTDGVLRSINEYALRMYGVNDPSSVVGKLNLFDSPYVDAKLKAKIQAGEDITLEFEYDFDRINDNAYYTSYNKKTMIYSTNVLPVWDKSRGLVGHMLLSRDVTSTKENEFRTEETKKNLEMAMDAAKMSSWVYDVHKKTFQAVHGDPIVKDTMSLEEALGKLHPQDSTRLMELFSKLINEEIQYGNITIRYFNDEEKRYRSYESRMRLSTEHLGKLQIVGTEVDVTQRLEILKKTKELTDKRELAMQVSGIVHWDFDVRTQRFESYNDPINDYASGKPVELQQYLNVLHPDDYSIFNDSMQSMLSGKNATINFTCRIKTKYDTSWQYCNITAVPFGHDELGNIVKYTGFRQNISKLHQLDEELKERNYKMELTFKTVGMSYWDFDVNTKLFHAFNDSVNDFDSERVIVPQEYIDCTHPDDQDAVRENLKLMFEGTDTDFSFECRSMTKWDKEWQNYIVTGLQAERDRKGKVVRYTGIRFNNTKWEKVTQELKALKEKAELSDRLKSAFLANMSHEIRTPLNAIVGFSELLVNCDDPQDKEEYVSIIQSNNELLLRLINDILDLSKIESGILERKREKFCMAKVCSELYTMIQPKITNPAVEFRMSPGPECWIFLDRNRLKQVWMNFLTNAVKCTKSGHIRMGYSLERGGIRFYVEDTGVGIPLELQDKVFGRFQKLNEFAQGTGLGLAISRAIIEAADGQIGFISTPGAGSTFWAWVPCQIYMQENELADNSLLSDAVEKPNKKNKDCLKILIAEDNDSNYLLVQHILKGFDLTRVINGADAVNKVREEHFDYVLMDMKMPIMGGLEAVRKIREFNKEIVIIALTANAFDADRIDALEAGCNVFLAKPLKKNQLLDILSENI